MKLKISLIVLFLVCVGLAVMLGLDLNKTHQLQKTRAHAALALPAVSNLWKQAVKDLPQARAVNAEMEKKIKALDPPVWALSNQLAEAKAQLDKAGADAKASEQAAQAELARKDARISELERQNEELGKRDRALTSLIADLRKTVVETERKITVSDDDCLLVIKALRTTLPGKAELDRAYHDPDALAAQLAKLESSLALAPLPGFPAEPREQVVAGSPVSTAASPAPRTGNTRFDPGLGMPAFPWPPPACTCLQPLPREMLPLRPGDTTLGAVADRLQDVFIKAGYEKVAFYAIANGRGFAMVARLERIDWDGRFRSLPFRWATESPPPEDFTLGWHIQALFSRNPGYFRLIAFVVSSEPVAPSAAPFTQTDASKVPTGGVDRLSATVASQPFGDAHKCSALIYEFERKNVLLDAAVRPASLLEGGARTHLERANLWQTLQQMATRK